MSQTTVLPVDDDILSTFGPAQFSKLRRDTNRHLMVRWINADLVNRAANDVRKSTVFYDAQGDFLYALAPDTWASITRRGEVADVLANLFAKTAVRYYSIGIR
jgi:hypothetical protein